MWHQKVERTNCTLSMLKENPDRLATVLKNLYNEKLYRIEVNYSIVNIFLSYLT